MDDRLSVGTARVCFAASNSESAIALRLICFHNDGISDVCLKGPTLSLKCVDIHGYRHTSVEQQPTGTRLITTALHFNNTFFATRISDYVIA